MFKPNEKQSADLVSSTGKPARACERAGLMTGVSLLILSTVLVMSPFPYVVQSHNLQSRKDSDHYSRWTLRI